MHRFDYDILILIIWNQFWLITLNWKRTIFTSVIYIPFPKCSPHPNKTQHLIPHENDGISFQKQVQKGSQWIFVVQRKPVVQSCRLALGFAADWCRGSLWNRKADVADWCCRFAPLYWSREFGHVLEPKFGFFSTLICIILFFEIAY